MNIQAHQGGCKSWATLWYSSHPSPDTRRQRSYRDAIQTCSLGWLLRRQVSGWSQWVTHAVTYLSTPSTFVLIWICQRAHVGGGRLACARARLRPACARGAIPGRARAVVVPPARRRAAAKWGRPPSLVSRSSQPGVYYPHGYIITHGCCLAVRRPGSSGDRPVAYMTPKSESRLGALRIA